MSEPESQTPPERPVAFESTREPARKFHWPWFTFALLLPPVLTMLAVTAERPGDMPAFIAMGGSPVAGLVCGGLLARRVTRTTTGLVLATLGFTVLFGAVIFSLCFAGCFAVAAAKGKI
jgi:hypothetical protein